MKKKFQIPAIIFVILGVTMSFWYFGSENNTNNDENSQSLELTEDEKEDEKEHEDETLEEEFEDFEELEEKSVVKLERSTQAITDGKVELMNYSIEMPVATDKADEEFYETINAYYKKEKSKLEFFIDEYEDKVHEEYLTHGEMFANYWLNTSSHVTFEDENLISIVRYVETFTGGSQVHPEMYSEVFRVSDGALMVMNDLFDIEKNKDKILEYCIENYIDDAYYANADELLYDLFDANNYFLTEQGVGIYYQKYDIAPGMTDLPVFMIPYNEIELKNDYKYLGEINE